MFAFSNFLQGGQYRMRITNCGEKIPANLLIIILEIFLNGVDNQIAHNLSWEFFDECGGYFHAAHGGFEFPVHIICRSAKLELSGSISPCRFIPVQYIRTLPEKRQIFSSLFFETQ